MHQALAMVGADPAGKQGRDARISGAGEAVERVGRPTEPTGAVLRLADGSDWRGRSIGAPGIAQGEVVFQTGHVGYVETLSDPAYRGQIVVFCAPMLGNHGVPQGPWESARVQAAGVIAAQVATVHRGSLGVSQWLIEHGVPALCDVDTRRLTLHLAAPGTLPGVLESGEAPGDALHALPPLPTSASLLAQVEPTEWHAEGDGGGPRLLFIDMGGKRSLVTAMLRRGARVLRAPASGDWEQVLDDVDGVVLTSGPGDPAALSALSFRLREILRRKLPILGVCLGHQLLCRSVGGTTAKLKYGHRGHNQPVQDLHSQRVYMTSQNHGFFVEEQSLGADWAPWFRHLNDGSCEGVRHVQEPWLSVQFHPEAAAGPTDTAWIFDEWLARVPRTQRRDP